MSQRIGGYWEGELLAACQAFAPVGENGVCDGLVAYLRGQGEHNAADLLTKLTNDMRAAIAKANE